MNERLARLNTALELWLTSDSLKQAADQTVKAGRAKSDVLHALRWVKERVTPQELERWVLSVKEKLSDSQEDGLSSDRKKVLVLHAGNLPLVGLQDAIAVYLSGHQYVGKISRRDAFLLPSFLQTLAKCDPGFDGRWSTDITLFEDVNADHLLFAGDKATIQELRNSLKSRQIISDYAKELIRTAKFSVLWLDEPPGNVYSSMVEAIERYEGQGCRSVKVIVSPYDIYQHSCPTTDYFEDYWTQNPTHSKPSSATRHRLAYNKSIDRKQLRLEHLVIEESFPQTITKDCVHWIQGTKDDVNQVVETFDKDIQTVYALPGKEEALAEKINHSVESITDAQFPPIYWRPDGVDVLEWLMNPHRAGQEPSSGD